MFAKVVAGSHIHKYHEMESKVIDFSVDTIRQRFFIKTLPSLKMFLDSGYLQHTFGFMTSNESLEADGNLSISPFDHDFKRFHSLVVYTDFIDDALLEYIKALVLKSFPIDKLHFETTQ